MSTSRESCNLAQEVRKPWRVLRQHHVARGNERGRVVASADLVLAALHGHHMDALAPQGLDQAGAGHLVLDVHAAQGRALGHRAHVVQVLEPEGPGVDQQLGSLPLAAHLVELDGLANGRTRPALQYRPVVVVGGLLGRIHGDEAEFELRDAGPILEPLGVDDAAATGRRPLLELASRAVWAEGFLQLGHLGLTKALWEHQLAFLGARVSPADAGGAAVLRLKAHRDAQVHVRQAHVLDDAGNVLLVQALHDDHDGRLVGVDAGRKRLGEGDLGRLQLGLAVGVVGADRVVQDDAVATHAGHGGEGSGLAHAFAGIPELALAVQVSQQLNRPELLEPVGLDQVAAASAVSDGQLLFVGRADKAHLGHVPRPPLPGWPDHAGQQGLHGAGWHVHQQAVDLALGHGLQVQANGVQRPSPLQLGSRFKHAPGTLGKLGQAAPAQLALDGQQVSFGQ